MDGEEMSRWVSGWSGFYREFTLLEFPPFSQATIKTQWFLVWGESDCACGARERKTTREDQREVTHRSHCSVLFADLMIFAVPR